MSKRFIDEVKVLENGKAEFNGFVYARKRYAYLVQARSRGTHSEKEWLDLCEEYNFKCCKCGSEVIGGIPTKDHIIPTVLGGDDSIYNLQPLCRQCNLEKGIKIIRYRHE